MTNGKRSLNSPCVRARARVFQLQAEVTDNSQNKRTYLTFVRTGILDWPVRKRNALLLANLEPRAFSELTVHPSRAESLSSQINSYFGRTGRASRPVNDHICTLRFQKSRLPALQTEYSLFRNLDH